MQKRICVLLVVAVWSLMSCVSCSKEQTIIGTEMTESYEEYFEDESIVQNVVETSQESESSQEPEKEILQESEIPQELEQETQKEEILEDSQEETEEVMVVSSWVSQLENAQNTTQIIAVACDGYRATVSMHTKNEQGIWLEEFSVKGRIGKNGVGKTQEGDKKTPVGVYKFNMAFGVLENPGITVMPYLQVDDSHHWVDDPNSKYYNQCVSTKEVAVNWDSSEHLYKVVPQYNYALAINYNEECVPNKGSAVFLHCNSNKYKYTTGCVSIPEEYMIEVMKKLKSDCVIIIDDAKNIENY